MVDELRRLEPADPSWFPLQAAPFNFLRNHELGSWHDLDPDLAVRDIVAQRSMIVAWNRISGTVAVHPPWADYPIDVYLFRSVEDIVRQLDLSGYPARPGPAGLLELAADLATISDALANLFQNAVEDGSCKIFARPNAAFSNFQLIPVDVWRNVTVTDWRAGTAASAKGDTLFSIHAAIDGAYTPLAKAQTLLRAATPAGRNFIEWFLQQYASKRLVEPSQPLIFESYISELKAQGLSRFGTGLRTLQPALKTAKRIRDLGLSQDELNQLANTKE